MYSDLIDSVKNPVGNEEALTRGEAFLFQTLLNGNRPTLTQTQAIDSPLILSIAQSADQRDYFLKAIQEGYIRICLYGQTRSLQGYLLQILKRNINAKTSQFLFSSMPFLYSGKYSNLQRLDIFTSLMMQIQEGNPTINSCYIDKDDKYYIEEYVNTITKINLAARNSYIPANEKPIQLKDVLQLIINGRLNTINDNNNLKKLLIFINTKCKSNYRSFYYDLLDKHAKDHDSSAIKETKELLDYCYNEVIASSVNDNEQAKLHIPNIFPELAASAAEFSSTKKVSIDEITVADSSKEYLDWERLLTILKEVEGIRNLKKCSWNDSLKIYASKQRQLPFKLGTKYMGVTAFSVAISSIPIIGKVVSDFTTEVIWSSTCDAFGEAVKKPSISEIIKASKESQKKCKMMKMISSQTSINIE